MNPTPTDGRSVQNAGLFCGRPPFRERLAKKIAAANPEMKLVHTDKGIEQLAMAASIKSKCVSTGSARTAQSVK
jgi:hypothetical protein